MRGHELVVALIDGCERGGDDGWDEDDVDDIVFPDGKDVPDSLKAWLAFDGTALFDFSPEDACSFAELIDREFVNGDTIRNAFDTDVYEVLAEPCLLLTPPVNGRGAVFLYLGEVDDVGDYPVMMLESFEGECSVEIEQPGFDCWITEEARAAYGVDADIAPDEREFDDGIAFHLDTNLEGERRFEGVLDGSFEDYDDEDEDDDDLLGPEFGPDTDAGPIESEY